jgi:cell division protein FtsQ
VARARVERIWPATIGVHVAEHRAVARWGDAGLVSDAHVVFVPGVLDAEALALPRLSGPAGRQAEVRAAHAALTDALRDGPFAPVALDLNARGEWTARTAQGVELRLGRGRPIDAVAALNGPVRTALEGRLTEVAYVDLHYINGFAVGWRERVVDDRSPAERTEERRE